MGVWEISVQTYTCKAEKLAVNLDFLKKCFNDQAYFGRGLVSGLEPCLHCGLGMPVPGS